MPRQERKAHGRKEKLTAKKKSSRQKRKAHGKREKLTAKMKNSQRKLKLAEEVRTRAGGVFDVFGVLHAVYNAIYTTRFFL